MEMVGPATTPTSSHIIGRELSEMKANLWEGEAPSEPPRPQDADVWGVGGRLLGS